MAYATGSLNILVPRMGTGEDAGSLGSALWTYRSDDPPATVIGAGYVDDGVAKGLKVNDIVIVIDDDTTTIDLCLVTVVAAGGDVTMINGT